MVGVTRIPEMGGSLFAYSAFLVIILALPFFRFNFRIVLVTHGDSVNIASARP